MVLTCSHREPSLDSDTDLLESKNIFRRWPWHVRIEDHLQTVTLTCSNREPSSDCDTDLFESRTISRLWHSPVVVKKHLQAVTLTCSNQETSSDGELYTCFHRELSSDCDPDLFLPRTTFRLTLTWSYRKPSAGCDPDLFLSITIFRLWLWPVLIENHLQTVILTCYHREPSSDWHLPVWM